MHLGSEEGGSETPHLLTLQVSCVSGSRVSHISFSDGIGSVELRLRKRTLESIPPIFIGRVDFSPLSCLSSWSALPSAATPEPAGPRVDTRRNSGPISTGGRLAADAVARVWVVGSDPKGTTWGACPATKKEQLGG